MLRLKLNRSEVFDEAQGRFFEVGEDIVVELQHSLFSLSKWEEKYEKPFLGEGQKTDEELRDYINMMVVGPENAPEDIFPALQANHIHEINEYINKKATATIIDDSRKKDRKATKEIVTSELIYFWMIGHTVPVEFQHWHLNRLLTLIQVCSIKSDTSQESKMSPRDIAKRNRQLNEQRRQALGTKG